MQRIEGLLNEWGRFHAETIDYADEYGENTLYRAGVLQGRVQEGRSGHKILCPDMPASLRAVERAVKALPRDEAMAVTLWYCAPPKPDGKRWTKAQLAKLANISKQSFKAKLHKGIKKLLTAKI